VDGTGSGVYPMMGLSISDTNPSGSNTSESGKSASIRMQYD
jgi:hypothetical protein